MRVYILKIEIFVFINLPNLEKNTAAENKYYPKIQPVLSSSQIVDEEQQLFLDSLVTRVSEECNILMYGEKI